MAGQFRGARASRPVAGVINLALIVLVFFGAASRFAFVNSESSVNAAFARNFPVEAARQLNGSALEGKLFNSYNWGGYLIFFARGHPVFIDGRTDLHRDRLADYVAALHADNWRDIFAKWEIDIVLIETKSFIGGAAHGGGRLAALLRR